MNDLLMAALKQNLDPLRKVRRGETRERVRVKISKHKCLGFHGHDEAGNRITDLDCGKDVHSRGLCQLGFQRYYQIRIRLGLDEAKEDFDEELIRDGLLLPSRQGQRLGKSKAS